MAGPDIIKELRSRCIPVPDGRGIPVASPALGTLCSGQGVVFWWWSRRSTSADHSSRTSGQLLWKPDYA
jgi:hypothetical protein